MLTYLKPSKIQIYVNTDRKTLAQIKAETGCTHILNGGLFNGDFTPCCHLKSDGQVLVKDQYRYWGYAWNNRDLTLVSDYLNYQNYISCVCLIRDGKAETLYGVGGIGGRRGRTAIGIMPDGRVLLYCTKDGTAEDKTPEELQAYILLSLGAASAVMLDGGGSSQCDFGGQTVNSSRGIIIHNLICFWAEQDSGNEPQKGKDNMTFGIDVSTWQGNFDFSAAKAEGVEFAIIRASYGREKDAFFEANYKAAKAAGLKVGAFLYALDFTDYEAYLTANWLIENCLKGKQFELPIYYDIEEWDLLNLSTDELTKIVFSFCGELEKNSFFSGAYSTRYMFEHEMNNVRKRFTPWVAGWSTLIPVFNDGTFIPLWQFGRNTNLLRSNKIAGVVCDQNYCYTDFETVIKSSGLNGFGTDTAPKPEEPTPEEPEQPKTTTLTEEQIKAICRAELKELLCELAANIIIGSEG